MCQENRPTASRCRVSYPQGWSEVSTIFLYIGPLVQTTSGNASRAILSSKSDWTLSRRRADIASAAKKVVFFAITFDPNAFSEIHESKTFKMQLAI